jgi:hypothetical protein
MGKQVCSEMKASDAKPCAATLAAKAVGVILAVEFQHWIALPQFVYSMYSSAHGSTFSALLLFEW